jgi:hypothetical protein
MTVNKLLSNGVRTSDVQVVNVIPIVLAIVVSSIIDVIDNVLDHHKSIRMVLSHSGQSVICDHLWISAHKVFIVLEINPV